MTYFDGVFRVQQRVFRPGESLVIDFAVRHSESELRLAVWTTSLPDNASPEPICTFIRNHLEIMIPQESKHIHGIVSVRISSQLDVSFEINGSIQSFDFLMMGWDTETNSLQQDTLTLVSVPEITQIVKFHVWMNQRRSSKDVEYDITPYQPVSGEIRIPHFEDQDQFAFELELTSPRHGSHA
jgi:hypothetical protein